MFLTNTSKFRGHYLVVEHVFDKSSRIVTSIIWTPLH